MARLKRAGRDDLTVRRVRRGRGFGYTDAAGATLRDAALHDRVRALGIPPAWTEVHIAPCLYALFERGKLGAMWSAVTETRGLRQREARLSGVLAAAG
ncbi:MAG: hypothetical protein Q8M47_03450 [Devosia sp.]|nr:hypothetical protein [Devosia sp.]